MAQKSNVDDLIREALKARGFEGPGLPEEPGLLDMVTEIFRGRMWWTGVLMTANILAGTILAVFCGIRFLAVPEVPDMIRWGAGLFICLIVVIGCKLWFWVRLERITVTREIKRVELLLVRLAAERRGQP